MAKASRGSRFGRMIHVSLSAGVAVGAIDLSPFALFLQASVVVKIVMIGLVAASVWSWAIIFEKWTSLTRLERQAKAFERTFWSGRALEELRGAFPEKRAGDPMARVFHAGLRALDAETDGGRPKDVDGAGGRIAAAMNVAASRVLDELERRLGFLATVGAVAPFVGLFGTVWGIMKTFGGIAESGATSLVVVAPGLAEALFATALGLLAAVPAVTAYNKFAGDLGRYGGRLEAFAQEFAAHLAREMARGRL